MGFWWLDKGSNHVCFVSRISVSFAAKRESQQLWFGLVLAQPSLFLPLLAFKKLLPSIQPKSLAAGTIAAVSVWAVVYFKGKNGKKF